MGKLNEIVLKFKYLWVFYILQSSLAAAVLYPLFFVFGEERLVLISAMGATAFIVFAMPTTGSAKAHVVIGSHIVGLISGALFSSAIFPNTIGCPLAVGLAIFLMVALDIEHPPAAGTAMAIVINRPSTDIFVTVIACAIILASSRYLLRHHLRNLV